MIAMMLKCSSEDSTVDGVIMMTMMAIITMTSTTNRAYWMPVLAAVQKTLRFNKNQLHTSRFL